jgi:hypothetical protein
LFTVFSLAATIASGVFLSGQQAPAPPRPALVTLDKADAAKLADAGRAAVQVEMPAGVELKLWAPDGLIADPVAVEVTPDGTVYVAGTQRNNLPLDIRGHQDWMTTAHTMKTVADLRPSHRRDVAGQQREERVDSDITATTSRTSEPGGFRSASPRHGHRRRRHCRQSQVVTGASTTIRPGHHPAS